MPVVILVASLSPSVACSPRKTSDQAVQFDPIKVTRLKCCHSFASELRFPTLTTRSTMPRILPRLIKALQRPPGPFEDELRIAPGLRSKANRKTRAVLPHKQRISIRVTRPALEYSKSLLLDEESQVKRRKMLPPKVKYPGQDGFRTMNEDELRWWSNPYCAYVFQFFVYGVTLM